jgi:hypothetical protein
MASSTSSAVGGLECRSPDWAGTCSRRACPRPVWQAAKLRTALALATQSHARVTLLHVVQQVAKIPLAEMRPFYRRLAATSSRRLAAAAKRRQGHPRSNRGGNRRAGEGNHPAGSGQGSRPRGDGLAQGEISPWRQPRLGNDELQGRDLLPVPDSAREVGRDTFTLSSRGRTRSREIEQAAENTVLSAASAPGPPSWCGGARGRSPRAAANR